MMTPVRGLNPCEFECVCEKCHSSGKTFVFSIDFQEKRFIIAFPVISVNICYNHEFKQRLFRSNIFYFKNVTID